MALFDTLLTGEIARRRRIGEARSKALADPTKMQNLLAKGMKSQVPEGRKIKTKKHPTKLAAVEAAIPKSDPRSGMGVATWSRYTEMMEDPRYKKFRPRDILAASSEIEFDERREATHKYIQKQKVGTFSTFLKEEYAPMPGQEEWEAEHPPPIAKMKAEESFAYGAGFAGLVMTGKSLGLDVASKLYKLSPAKKAALRTALETSKRNPWIKLAVAGGAAIPSMIAYEQVQARSKAAMMKTEVGQEHPLAVEITSHAMGLATGLVGFERAALGVFARKGAADPLRYIKKLKDAVFKKDTAGEAAMDNPAAKEILAFKEATLAAEKASDKAVATMDKDKVATMKRLVDTVEKEKTAAIPLPGAVTRRGIWTPEGLEAIQRRGEVPIIPAEGVIKYTPEELERARRAAGIGVPVKSTAIPIEKGTPNLPMLRPDGSLATLGSRQIVKYNYGNIKSEEGFDRVLSEVSEGKRAIDVVQKVGEMEEGIARHSKVIPKKKVTFALKKKMSELGYDAEDVAGMNAKIAANIERFSGKKREPSVSLDKALREVTPSKPFESKVGLDLPNFHISEKAGIIKAAGPEKYSVTILENRFGARIERTDGQEVFRVRGPGLPKEGVTAIEDQLSVYGLKKPWVGKYKPEYRTEKELLLDTSEIITSGGVINIEAERARGAGLRLVASKIAREPIPQKIKSKIDLSDLSQEERLYNFAKTRTPQQRADLVERGTISEEMNRRIVREQREVVEKGKAFKEFAAKEAEADATFMGMGTGSVPKDDGSYKAMTKAEFVLKMMSEQARKATGKSLAITAASAATMGALSMPDGAEAGVMDSMVKVFKAATRTEGKAAASRLNLEYNGVQEGLDGPLCHLFTDHKRGATFAVKSIDEVDVKAALETSERIWEVANAGKNTAIGATVFAALTTTLGNIFSPAEAEAAGIVDMGRTLSGLTATILKDAIPGKVKDLVKEMKGSGLIAKSQIDHCYVLPEPRKSLNIIPNVKDVTKKKSLPPGAEGVVSPHVQFLYYTGVREGQELMNNAGVQWGSCQGTAVWNSMQGHKTLMNILEDFIPNYKSSANGAIKAMASVVEKFHVPMQERAYHLGMARKLKRSYEKEFSKLTKKKKFKKGEADEGLAAVTRLEDLYKEHNAAYKASEAMKDEYQAAWHKTMAPFASKPENAGTRIFLAAEDTANFEHYPWLKDILTWEEKAAAAKLKDMMEHYSVRAIEAGEKVITTRPFMHHAWHPAMKSELARLNKGATLMSPPMTKLHSRSAGYMPMVPDAEYSVTSYLQDINIRLEAMEFWKKGEKDGWWAYKKWLTENPSQAPEGLIKAFNQFEKGFKPVDTSGGFNKFSEKVYAFEVARLLAFSASVPFKHALKLVADLRVFGTEGVKAMPKAASSIVKTAIKQRGGEEWLKKHGWGLDVVDEAVEAYTETGKLYRVVSDISPFRVNESMTDKAIGKFNEIGGTPTSIVERFDRALSTVAGINMAAKRGMTPAQATYAIFDTILKSNFLSGQLNPSWLRNPVIRLMMIFQGTPFKIMEQRIALHGRAWKGVGETLGQLRRDVIKGEQDFKWEMIKQGFGKQKDIFGNTLLSQSIREMVLVGTGITAAKYVWDGDLSHHFFHPPFFKAQKRDIAIGASPLVNASLETYSKYMDEDYDDFVVSTFFNSWFDSTWKGVPAPIPVNFKKAARLTENDIPEIYRDSKLRYLFGIPAIHD